MPGGGHPRNSGRRDNAVTSLRLESRLTAAPRTGMLDTMRSVEARHPSVGVPIRLSARGVSSIDADC